MLLTCKSCFLIRRICLYFLAVEEVFLNISQISIISYCTWAFSELLCIVLLCCSAAYDFTDLLNIP